MNNKQDSKPSKNQSLQAACLTPPARSQSELLRTPEKIKQRQPLTAEKSESKGVHIKIDHGSLELCLKEPVKQATCNCRKSQCLKMYCVCFSDGKMCNNACLCDSCLNKNDNQSRSEAINDIITRDPFAFSKGFTIKNENLREGCHCKRSNCSKKYCQCFRIGNKCGKNCFCVDCENFKKEELSTPVKRVKLQ